MASIRPRYSKDEFARIGDEIYESIRSKLTTDREGQIVAIDIESGDYEVDADELTASDQLAARVPNAQIWVRRVGSRFARHFGPRGRTANS